MSGKSPERATENKKALYTPCLNCRMMATRRCICRKRRPVNTVVWMPVAELQQRNTKLEEEVTKEQAWTQT